MGGDTLHRPRRSLDARGTDISSAQTQGARGKAVTTELTFRVSERIGDVAALLQRPAGARWLLVLAHGAGAGMRHVFMESLAAELAGAGIATLRYQFPYVQQRRARPDPPAVLTATVRAAIAAAAEVSPDLPLLAGGKSLGGRMTSHVFADLRSDPMGGIAPVRGLVFFGFPLHPPGRPDTKRAEHLHRVDLPMLFLQGTRDTLADLPLIQQLCTRLTGRATLHVIDTADHSFHVLKRSGKTDSGVLHELANAAASWAESLLS
jgi:predicted alpha/beta-hydrolase family hydrolase